MNEGQTTQPQTEWQDVRQETLSPPKKESGKFMDNLGSFAGWNGEGRKSKNPIGKATRGALGILDRVRPQRIESNRSTSSTAPASESTQHTASSGTPQNSPEAIPSPIPPESSVTRASQPTESLPQKEDAKILNLFDRLVDRFLRKNEAAQRRYAEAAQKSLDQAADAVNSMDSAAEPTAVAVGVEAEAQADVNSTTPGTPERVEAERALGIIRSIKQDLQSLRERGHLGRDPLFDQAANNLDYMAYRKIQQAQRTAEQARDEAEKIVTKGLKNVLIGFAAPVAGFAAAVLGPVLGIAAGVAATGVGVERIVGHTAKSTLRGVSSVGQVGDAALYSGAAKLGQVTGAVVDTASGLGKRAVGNIVAGMTNMPEVQAKLARQQQETSPQAAEQITYLTDLIKRQQDQMDEMRQLMTQMIEQMRNQPPAPPAT